MVSSLLPGKLETWRRDNIVETTLASEICKNRFKFIFMASLMTLLKKVLDDFWWEMSAEKPGFLCLNPINKPNID
jgi:hypothetical protein